jgi:hypothetical protein
MKTLVSFFVLLVFAALSSLAGDGGERTKVRLLYSFEDPGEVARLLKGGENAQLIMVQDNGVTQGANCARLVVPRGVGYGTIRFDADAMRNWGDFDYFAIDVFTEDDHPYPINFELWDGLSKNYGTRCTFENVTTRPGRQTLLYHIARAKRNNKEGRTWEELEPRDKINLNGLTQVKIFLTSRKDRDAIFWIDNLRLLQEDAAKPKLKVPLPAGALAFNFGSPGSHINGFKTVSSKTSFSDKAGYGFTSIEGLVHGGEGWPDLLAGTFVHAGEGQTVQFQAKVPKGTYHAWLCAGPILRAQPKDLHFLLKLQGTDGAGLVIDEKPTPQEYLGEKYLFRFLNTQYSQKPHAPWQNYIDRMYPVRQSKLSLPDGMLTLTAKNYFLSGLILLPAEVDPTPLVQKIQELRMASFEKNLRPLPSPDRTGVSGPPGDVPGVCFIPEDQLSILPWTGPPKEKGHIGWDLAGAPGQRLVLRLAVAPFTDLGSCTLELADLKGQGVIPQARIKGYFQNYRYDGDRLGEMVLLPRLTLDMEAGLTQCYWLWLEIPANTPPGNYQGTLTFRPGKGEAKKIPLQLEVYPFTLEPVLPVAFGMYYNPRREPLLPAEESRLLKEQLQFMRQVGFTSVSIPAPVVTGLGKGNQVNLRFDKTMFDLAREVGMGQHPRQEIMTQALGIGRAIGRRLPGSPGPAVDRNPGLELKQPEFRGYFLNALKQYKSFLDNTGLPVAVEIVDEPREMPNPWNRNLADTLQYGNLLKEAGLRTFVTPMGDSNSGKDYTVLADNADIISVHAWKASSGLMERTRKNGKTLWLYNTGMDRFSWGFYNWRAGSSGRWEWHFCWHEEKTVGGYPGRDWYNPFTSMHGFAPNAPPSFLGGMLFQSRFLEVAEGINDYAYLITLEQALEKTKKEEVARSAREFLAALKRVIPEHPETKGLASDSDGALVGLGINDEVRRLTPQWRKKIGEYLKKL